MQEADSREDQGVFESDGAFQLDQIGKTGPSEPLPYNTARNTIGIQFSFLQYFRG